MTVRGTLGTAAPYVCAREWHRVRRLWWGHLQPPGGGTISPGDFGEGPAEVAERRLLSLAKRTMFHPLHPM